MDKTNNFPGGQTNNFNLAVCFPYFRLIVFSKHRKLIESQVGTPVAKVITFSNLGVIFYNITCCLLYLLLFVLFHVSF